MTKVKTAAALCCALRCAAGGGGASAFIPPPTGGGGGAAPPAPSPFADVGRSDLLSASTPTAAAATRSSHCRSSFGRDVDSTAAAAAASSRRGWSRGRRRRGVGGAVGRSTALWMTSKGGDAHGSSGGSSDAEDKKPDPSPGGGGKKPDKPLRAPKEESDAQRSDRYERTYRIARARSEIESLLSGPDPPFDADAELAKIPGGVKGIPPPVSMDDSEAELESKTAELEGEIYDAVEAGRYDDARLKRDELSREVLDDCGLVLQANLRFYRAFSSKDYDSMSKLWLHDASVLCVHPSHAPLVGASAVLGSWKRMFDSGSTGFRRNVVEPSRVRLSLRGATAILTCDEEVYTRRFVRGKRRKTELVNRLTATNVFRKVGGRWRMVHHHAAWHADSDAARRALGGTGTSQTQSRGGFEPRHKFSDAPSPSGGSSKQKDSGAGGELLPGPDSVESSRGIPDHEGITGKGYGEKSSKSSNSGDDDEDSFSGIEGLSSLGGLGGLGGSGGNLSPDGSNGPVRRVFMGSLSDLLNGGLSDILSSGPGSSSSGEGKIIDARGGGNDDDDESDGPSIIRFFTDDDDDDDDDEQEEDHDDRHENGSITIDNGMSVSFVKKSADGGATIIRTVKKSGDDDDHDDNNEQDSRTSKKKGAKDAEAEDANGGNDGNVPKDALRQNCISALRRLAAQGAISAKQKRTLLTDIILCSARGEFSMVEVAYELLCGECSNDDEGGKGNDDDDNGCVPEERSLAEEEFADQCRVFASSLPESPPYAPPAR